MKKMIDKIEQSWYTKSCSAEICWMEKYSRGWRGAPAKGVGRSRGARVQIPLSPLWLIPLKFNLLDGRETRYKTLKKVLDNVEKML